MKKRIVALILAVFTIAICLFNGCGVALLENDKESIESAYLSYLN